MNNIAVSWLGGIAAAIILFFVIWGYRRGFVKELISTVSLILVIGIVWFVNPYVNTFLRDHTQVYSMVAEATSDYVENRASKNTALGSSEQAGIIEQLKFPTALTEELEDNNTASVYEKLRVDTFVGYISNSLTETVMNGLSFLISYLLAWILIKAATYLLDLFTMIPGVHGINKVAGGILGGVKSIVFIWIAMLIITILCNTPVGEQGLDMIRKDPFLSFLYNYNLIAKYFTNILYYI